VALVPLRLNDRLEEEDPSFWMVEVDEKRPVDEPCARVKLGERGFWKVVGVCGGRHEEGGGRRSV